MCKTVPIFLLLFAEYLFSHTYANVTVGASLPMSETTEASPSVPRVTVTPSHALTSPQGPGTTQPPTTQSLPERDLSTQLAAGISISVLLLFILVMIGVWCLRKKSKRNSAEITSGPSGGVGESFNRRETTQVVF